MIQLNNISFNYIHYNKNKIKKRVLKNKPKNSYGNTIIIKKENQYYIDLNGSIAGPCNISDITIDYCGNICLNLIPIYNINYPDPIYYKKSDYDITCSLY